MPRGGIVIAPALRLATGLVALPCRAARRGAVLAAELARIGLAGPDRLPRALAATVAAADGLLADAGVPAAVRTRLNPLRRAEPPAPDGGSVGQEQQAPSPAGQVPGAGGAVPGAGGAVPGAGGAVPGAGGAVPGAGGAVPGAGAGGAVRTGRAAPTGTAVAPDGAGVPFGAGGSGPGADGPTASGPAATRLAPVGAGGTAGPPGAAGGVPEGAVIGEDVAATAGAVVLCDPAFELIHYLPRTATVRATPLLVVPPPGEPFLAADLAPGHSLVERLVASGQQVLLVSWAEGGDPGPALVTALDACLRIARTPAVALLGFGAGAAAAARLADADPQRVAALTLVADGAQLPQAPRGPARRIERDVADEGWWPEHAAWLHEHTGPDVTAPAELGGRGLPPLVPAPGALLAAQSPGRSCS